jgi:hypothetical protein
VHWVYFYKKLLLVTTATSDAIPPAWFSGHGHAPSCSIFASTLRSYGEGPGVLLLRPFATAAAGWRWRFCACCCLLRVALVVVHSRFTYVKH